jgi:transcriptional regulator with XRE-family HTH domain
MDSAKDMERHAILDALIASRELTATQVAKDTGIARSTLADILRGGRKINASQLLKLSEYFGVSVDYLMGKVGTVVFLIIAFAADKITEKEALKRYEVQL